MQLHSLELESFKKVKKVEIVLAGINVLVGGNNAGKSSVLQGIHFSVAAAIASRIAGKDTYPQDSLLYCPSRSFEDLRHGEVYGNQSNFSFLKIIAEYPDDVEKTTHTVRVYRGRNEGNVGCVRTTPRPGQISLGLAISNAEDLFSIYVPGLAGIPQSEQFRSESVIRRGVASGDANMYLRNVLLLISAKKLLTRLIERMKTIFPQFWVNINFDPKRDIFIDVQVSTTGANGRKCPLELVGTGVLQALQIFSYVTLFEPKLILLDEPDAHLHPDNQVLLATTLQHIASETSTKVIVSTHSRHLVDALYENSNFVWLKDGTVFEQSCSMDLLPMLIDIGALDSYDKLKTGKIKYVILSEDRKMEFLKILAQESGFASSETLYFSYKTSTNLESAIMLAEFIMNIAPTTKVIVHRDRDFMTDEEVDKVTVRISESGASVYITEGSDVESHFVNEHHLAVLLGVKSEVVEDWVEKLALDGHNGLSLSFGRKREEIKNLLYKKNPNDFPDTAVILGNAIPISKANRKGKDMLKVIRGKMHETFGKTVDVTKKTPHLRSETLLNLV
jgi:energy-coupling factor transporter ATP-binding protein EcfA2